MKSRLSFLSVSQSPSHTQALSLSLCLSLSLSLAWGYALSRQVCWNLPTAFSSVPSGWSNSPKRKEEKIENFQQWSTTEGGIRVRREVPTETEKVTGVWGNKDQVGGSRWRLLGYPRDLRGRLVQPLQLCDFARRARCRFGGIVGVKCKPSVRLTEAREGRKKGGVESFSIGKSIGHKKRGRRRKK